MLLSEILEVKCFIFFHRCFIICHFICMSVVLEMSYLFILLVCHCVNSIHYFTSDESIIADDKYYKLIQKKV